VRGGGGGSYLLDIVSVQLTHAFRVLVGGGGGGVSVIT
jgi:hypothetical protein